MRRGVRDSNGANLCCQTLVNDAPPPRSRPKGLVGTVALSSASNAARSATQHALGEGRRVAAGVRQSSSDGERVRHANPALPEKTVGRS